MRNRALSFMFMGPLVAATLATSACNVPTEGDLEFGYNGLDKPIVTLPTGQAPPPGLPGDGDFDGYAACGTEGWPATHCDCDDGDRGRNPGVTELCSDGLDNDCDTLTDGDDVDELNNFGPDWDMDGSPVYLTLGSGSLTLMPGCNPAQWIGPALDYLFDPSDELTDIDPASLPFSQMIFNREGNPLNKDCNDLEPSVHWLAAEVCNDRDDDCDTEIDEGPADPLEYFEDGDGDMWGAGEGGEFCPGDEPDGWVGPDGDCDDTNEFIYPGATELPGDGVDQNCDGFELCYADNDGDGVGAGDPVLGGDADCTDPGESAWSTDCDDADVLRFPGNPESCNEIDDDCDGLVDGEDDSVTLITWYADADDDTYGSLGTTFNSCAQPDGYVLDWSDCNDDDQTTYPGAPESCATLPVDNDCDGLLDEAWDTIAWFRDADNDNYGVPSPAFMSCVDPGSSYASTTDDCNDANPAFHPGATELPDGLDNDCDGVDDDDAAYTTMLVVTDPTGLAGDLSLLVFARDVDGIKLNWIDPETDPNWSCAAYESLGTPAIQWICNWNDWVDPMTGYFQVYGTFGGVVSLCDPGFSSDIYAWNGLSTVEWGDVEVNIDLDGDPMTPDVCAKEFAPIP